MGSINKGSFQVNKVSINSKGNSNSFNKNTSSKNKFNFNDMHKPTTNNFKVPNKKVEENKD